MTVLVVKLKKSSKSRLLFKILVHYRQFRNNCSVVFPDPDGIVNIYSKDLLPKVCHNFATKIVNTQINLLKGQLKKTVRARRPLITHKLI